ncbi:MAG TPA: hypothetical protein EYN69_03905 [Flavobacteriales bacterium]|nr:hypothetical protein [Flavobacteriales bacterium]
MRTLWTIGLAFILTSAFGQSNTEDTILLRDLYKRITPNNLTYIRESAGRESMKKRLLDKSYRKFIDSTWENLQLTDQEYEYLLDQIELNKDFVWKDSLLANSQYIPKDSIWTYLHNERRKWYEIYKQNPATENLKRERPWVFQFSRPIYLRDNQLCLLYYVALCGKVSGHYQIAFYKKEEDAWIEWIVIGGGDY